MILQQTKELFDFVKLTKNYVVKELSQNRVLIIIDKGSYVTWKMIFSESKLFNTRHNPASKYEFILIIDKGMYDIHKPKKFKLFNKED